MRKLLVVVDMQKDFIDGALGFDGAEKIIPGIAELIASYKKNGDEVVYTLDTHHEDYSDTAEGRHLPVPHCIEGTEGHELCDELKEALKDCRCFYKTTFGSLELGKYIEGCGEYFGSIELCGLVSNICVLSNAVVCKAVSPDSEIIVNSSLTASMDETIHKECMDILKGIHVNVL